MSNVFSGPINKCTRTSEKTRIVKCRYTYCRLTTFYNRLGVYNIVTLNEELYQHYFVLTMKREHYLLAPVT